MSLGHSNVKHYKNGPKTNNVEEFMAGAEVEVVECEKIPLSSTLYPTKTRMPDKFE